MLQSFLVQAKTSTYAAGDNAKKIKELDHSTTITYEDNDWKYHDNYFGGEPYGGREVVFFRWEPHWMMTYYGWVIEDIKNVWEIYTVLQCALRNISIDSPYRWPKEFQENNYTYKNDYQGNIDQFSGEEYILDPNWVEVYRARYMWWLIDQKR